MTSIPMKKILPFLLVCLTTLPAMAELSEKYKEWGAGPAQWIMTPDETRAWRKIATDDEAIAFIDLFWARRDPTPNTAANEARNEHESRIAYADKEFTEKRKRGALTDRGRTYIVMGAPTTMNGTLSQGVGQMGAAGDEDTSAGFTRVGTRYVWVWERGDARKFDLARVEVVFNEDAATHKVQRNPRFPDFGRANPVAIRKMVVNPELTAVPEWAAFGGLEPKGRVTRVVEETVPAPVVAPEPDPAPAAVPDDAPVVASNTPGVSRLTLLARPAANPFDSPSETTFKAGRDVPFAVQYCSAKAETPRLKFMLLMTGPLDGKSTEQRTREKDAKLERLNAQPGCYALRGTVPVSKLTPGRYKVNVMIDAPDGDTWTVKQEFRVE